MKKIYTLQTLGQEPSIEVPVPEAAGEKLPSLLRPVVIVAVAFIAYQFIKKMR